MSAILKPVEARFEAFQASRADQLNAVLAVELRAYAHPWNRSNFVDALQSGYQAQLLLADDLLLGYFIAMKGVQEVHLLNITIAPEHLARAGPGSASMRWRCGHAGRARSGCGWRCASAMCAR